MLDLKKASWAQIKLESHIILYRKPRKINFVGGIDCGYDLKQKKIGAVVVVLSYPDLNTIEKSIYVSDLKIPYIPGFLNLREAPVMLKALRRLRRQPDIIMVDGNGVAHPRRMGLAAYLGVVLNTSTIGCAKNPFFPFIMPDLSRGKYTVYRDKNGIKVGYCLRTQNKIKPVFVSPGNKIDYERARDLVLVCSKFRIPEPIREAHKAAQKLFKKS